MQVVELLKLTNQQIALAFRVPLQILSLGGAPFSSTEALLNFWLASGLGFALNHIEQAFDKLFGLEGEPDDYCEFSTESLLRSAEKDRIDARVRAISGGLLSPNEARNLEGLDSVPFGDSPRLQAQCVPLSAAADVSAVPSAPSAPSQPAAEATSYQDEVMRDIKALTARGKRQAPYTFG